MARDNKKSEFLSSGARGMPSVMMYAEYELQKSPSSIIIMRVNAMVLQRV